MILDLFERLYTIYCFDGKDTIVYVITNTHNVQNEPIKEATTDCLGSHTLSPIKDPDKVPY